jgi:hypothetical protein
MLDMDTTTYLSIALLGLGLAASSGLNTFLPLLILALAARLELFGVQLNGSFAWLASDAALGVLGVAAFAEIIADKVPSVDHALDVFGTVARPAAGALAAASVFHQSDPAFAAALGLIIGAPTALGFHAAKAGTRVSSSAGTFGLFNPVLSFLEDMAVLIMTFTALMAPFLVPVFLLIFGFALWKLLQFARRKVQRV